MVLACDDEVVPLQSRIENVADDADLDEAYATERHLLCVACTKPEPPDKEQPVEPQADATNTTGG